MRITTTIEISKEMRQTVIKYVRKNGHITNRQCRELLELGYDQVIRLFNSMVDSGELIREGKTTSVKYTLPK
jgi:predicted HTH transcriptional regulator